MARRKNPIDYSNWADGAEHHPGKPTDAEVRALKAAIPDDHRTMTGKLCGDPYPERSALVQRCSS